MEDRSLNRSSKDQLKRQMTLSMSEELDGEDLQVQNEFERVFAPLFESLDNTERTELLRNLIDTDKNNNSGNEKKDFKKQREGIKNLENFSQSPESNTMRKFGQLASLLQGVTYEPIDDVIIDSIDINQIINVKGIDKVLIQSVFEDAKIVEIKNLLNNKLFDINMICKFENETLIQSYAKSFLGSADSAKKEKYTKEKNEIIDLFKKLKQMNNT